MQSQRRRPYQWSTSQQRSLWPFWRKKRLDPPCILSWFCPISTRPWLMASPSLPQDHSYNKSRETFNSCSNLSPLQTREMARTWATQVDQKGLSGREWEEIIKITREGNEGFSHLAGDWVGTKEQGRSKTYRGQKPADHQLLGKKNSKTGPSIKPSFLAILSKIWAATNISTKFWKTAASGSSICH